MLMNQYQKLLSYYFISERQKQTLDPLNSKASKNVCVFCKNPILASENGFDPFPLAPSFEFNPDSNEDEFKSSRDLPYLSVEELEKMIFLNRIHPNCCCSSCFEKKVLPARITAAKMIGSPLPKQHRE